jgi:enoyl-CoA hydratase
VSEPVLCELRNGVAVLTLNRPEVLNALDRATLKALLASLERLGTVAELRAVLVTGAGRAFAAGADIAEMSALDPAAAEAFSREGHRALAALEALPVPTIAAVNGYALGGGCELACACDWIYASRSARFGQPEVKLGLIPGFGATSRLVRRVGVAWAKELILTGEPIDAEAALRIGLVNRLFDAEQLLEAAEAAAASVARRGPRAVALAKRVMHEGQDADGRVASVLEQHAFGVLFAGAESREGLDAFLDKREPKFGGNR